MSKILPKKLPPKRFHLGDKVQFQWGKYRMEGIVNEEERPLGKDAAMLVGVQFNPDPEITDPDYFFQTEVYADELELLEPASREKNRARL